MNPKIPRRKGAKKETENTRFLLKHRPPRSAKLNSRAIHQRRVATADRLRSRGLTFREIRDKMGLRSTDYARQLVAKGKRQKKSQSRAPLQIVPAT